MIEGQRPVANLGESNNSTVDATSELINQRFQEISAWVKKNFSRKNIAQTIRESVDNLPDMNVSIETLLDPSSEVKPLDDPTLRD